MTDRRKVRLYVEGWLRPEDEKEFDRHTDNYQDIQSAVDLLSVTEWGVD